MHQKNFQKKNKEAIETLKRVHSEWFANQKIIKWKVITPPKNLCTSDDSIDGNNIRYCQYRFFV